MPVVTVNSKVIVFRNQGKIFFKILSIFRPFKRLPDENDLEDGYWIEDNSHGICTAMPACTWFFMAIQDETAQLSFLRNRVGVRDRMCKENISIAFYPEQNLISRL